MLDKIKEMLQSIRFWYAIGLGFVIYFEAVGAMDKAVADALKTFFLAGITVRTASELAGAIREQK